MWSVRYLGRKEGEAQRNGPGSRAQSCEQGEKREEAGDKEHETGMRRACLETDWEGQSDRVGQNVTERHSGKEGHSSLS